MAHRQVGVDGIGEGMTKVSVIAPGPPWTNGGVERSAGRLVSYLDRWGLEWRYLSGFDERKGSPPGFIRVRGSLRGPTDRVAFGWLASCAAVRERPDIIHVHGSEYGWGIGAALAVNQFVRRRAPRGRSSVRPKVVVTCHGTLRSALVEKRGGECRSARWSHRASETVVSLVESRVLEYATAVVCVSDLVRSEIEGLYGVPSAKIHVVPNAIDTNVFAPPPGGLEARGGYILWVGRDARYKGLDAALRIFGDLRARLPAAELRVVGVRRPQAPPGVEYLGGRAVGDLARLYAGARLLLSTSFYEGDPLAVKEAMACGTPALVSAAASAAVRHGENGLVVTARPDSAMGRDEFVHGALRVIADDALWGRLSRGAVSARSTLSPDVEEQAYRGIYRELGASV
jgi:glycosyltransferase involved in cell wall biosynthesis